MILIAKNAGSWREADSSSKTFARIVSLGDDCNARGTSEIAVPLQRLVSLGETQEQDLWVCAICCQTLRCHPEEIGAVTFQGKRVEAALYHGGCVSMMLLHSQQKHSQRNLLNASELSWGLSPVTRQRVDGFLRMPAPMDHERWLDFCDWRGTGQFDCLELVRMLTSVYAISACDLQDALLNKATCTTGATKVVSRTDVAQRLLPLLTKHVVPPCEKIVKLDPREEVQTNPIEGPIFVKVVARMVTILPSLSMQMLTALRCTCRKGVEVSRLLFLQDVCACLEHPEAGLDLPSIASLLCGILVEGDSAAVHASVNLLRHADAMLRESAANILGKASRGELSTVQALIEVLADPLHSVRECGKHAIRSLASSFTSDIKTMALPFLRNDDPRFKRAVMVALVELCIMDSTDAIDIVVSLTNDEEASVRVVACRTLPSLSCKGNALMKQALLARLHDNDSHTQAAALQSLARIAEMGDQSALTEILSFLKRLRKHCTATFDARGQLPLVCLMETGVKILGTHGKHSFEAYEFCKSVEANMHPRIVSASKIALSQFSIGDQFATKSKLSWWRCRRRTISHAPCPTKSCDSV